MKNLLAVIFICLYFTMAFTSCEKQTITKDEISRKAHVQKEIALFIDKIEERGDDAFGEMIIYTDGKTPSREINSSSSNEFEDILGPIIEKLSSNGLVTSSVEDEAPHGSADCKYCTKLGGITCGKQIAEQIPSNAGEIHITISKKDKKGCRNIHAEW